MSEKNGNKISSHHIVQGESGKASASRLRYLQPNWIVGCLFIAVFAAIGVYLLLGGHADTPFAGSITNFTDPSYYTSAQQGRSFWAKPERGYMNTVPATTLVNSLGSQFEGFSPPERNQIYHLISDNGFTAMRIGLGWSKIDYNNPTVITPNALANFQTNLLQLKANHLRPLITLMAPDFGPDPMQNITATFLKQPKVGDTTVQVSPATAAQIVPGRTGINTKNQTNSKTIDVIFTSVAKDGTVTLSKPISSVSNLNGTVTISRYAPFQRPFLADGKTPNPVFTDTMNGWLNYVKAVSTVAKTALGGDNFDLEIWNELLGNHAFLSTGNYYTNQAPDASYQGSVQQQILAQTGAYIANPANGMTNVRVTDGFASQTPWAGASNLPNGITALSKHAYDQSQRVYPAALDRGTGKNDWVNALGKKEPTAFAPNYVSHFPEVYLTGPYEFFNSELRDMSPITTYSGNTAYGTNATNSLGQKKQLWETEWGMSLQADPQGLQSVPASTPGAVRIGSGGKGNGPAYAKGNEVDYIEAKGHIRYLASYINKGMTKVFNGLFNFISPTGTFVNDIQKDPNTYPGASAGGEVMTVMGRFLHAFSGAQPISQPRSLSLQQLDDYSGNIQFKGDGTAAHPTLYDRDVFGFFPYQLTNNSFVIPVYIQTEDIEKIYNKSATDPTKFDEPAATYRLTIGGVYGNNVTSTSLYDPLTNQSFPVHVISRTASNIVAEIPVTDSPRLLSVTECGGGSGCNNGGGQHQSKAPTIKFLTPTNGQAVSGVVNLTVDATNDPSTSIANVTYQLDGARLPQSTETVPPYAYAWHTTGIGNGLHTLAALVQDGNGKTASAQIQVSLNGSVASPTVTITTLNGKQNISSPVTLQSVATSDPSTTVKSVQYLLDKNPVSPPITKLPYSFTLDPAKFSLGKHQLEALVTDGDGNTARDTQSVVIK